MIYCSSNKNIRNILIEDDIDDKKLFFTYLKLNNKITQIKITLINITHIEKDLFLALYTIKDNLKLFVNSELLVKYFFKFGILCELKNNDIEELQILDNLRDKYFLNDDILDLFLENIFTRYSYDFREYNKSFLLRRIKLFINLKSKNNDKDILNEVLKNKKLFDEFKNYIFINVTEFFRNPNTFKDMQKNILPYLDTYPSIKIWCSACSNGSEAYSIAMLFDEMGLLNKTQIYATDIDENILQEAKNGLFDIDEFNTLKTNYNKISLKTNISNWINTHDNFVEIKDYIKNHILFMKHNLVTDSTINEFNLILCRNVLIYFDKYLKIKVFNTLNNSLKKDGFLVLGDSESLYKSYKYNIIANKRSKIFQKDYS